MTSLLVRLTSLLVRIKFDPAAQRVLRIDIDNPSRSSLIRQVDVNRYSHSTAQPNCGCDQCSVKVDDDGLAIARPMLSATLNNRDKPPLAGHEYFVGTHETSLWGA